MLSGDPTAIDPEHLDTLKAVETIKEGETIFALSDAKMKKGHLMVGPGGAAERSFAEAIRGVVGEHEYARLPRERQNFFTRTALRASPYNGICIPAALLAILTPPGVRGRTNPGRSVRRGP